MWDWEELIKEYLQDTLRLYHCYRVEITEVADKLSYFVVYSYFDMSGNCFNQNEDKVVSVAELLVYLHKKIVRLENA